MYNLFTLVIPTHNRPLYLRRALEYYSRYNFNIIITDSSDIPFKDISKYNNIDYYFKPKEQFNKKISDALNNVKTKYVAIGTDDDFLIINSIKNVIDYLELNSDYSSAQGHYSSYNNENSNELIYQPAYPHSVGININDKSGNNRLKHLFSNYMHLSYSIHRTENLNNIWNIAKEKIYDYNLIELLLATISVINGKHKILPIFYCLREFNSKSYGQTTKNILELLDNIDYKSEYNIFINEIALFLSNKDNTDFKTAKQQVENAINIYLSNLSKKKYSKLIRKIKSNYFIKNHLEPQYEKIRSFSKRRRMFKQKQELIEKTKNISGFPFFDIIAKKELQEIEANYIKKYPVN